METKFREKPFSIRSEIRTHEAGRETFLIRLLASNAAISQRGSSVRVRMCPCLFIPPQCYLFITSSTAVSLPCTRSQPWSPLTVRSIRLPPPYHFLPMLTYTVQPTHTHTHTSTQTPMDLHIPCKKKKRFIICRTTCQGSPREKYTLPTLLCAHESPHLTWYRYHGKLYWNMIDITRG